jgi:hypothetical protein
VWLLYGLALAVLVAASPTQVGAQPFQQLDGCTCKPQRRNDGDSFHVILPDKKELIFSAHVFDAPGRAPLFLSSRIGNLQTKRLEKFIKIFIDVCPRT